ncbi:membrane-associated protein [Pullulanibacillus pueri]|uniref:Membrane protein n=1 Tax=Pullulanibacillus pueri TaxID=1437324 RepID=A0A8J3ELS4_9BACL|nr:VTT domain-containing protein [Pullulanibacillus pueri]MBM7682236.1 membrane-associated protein [Pullulanibacillus pueri]GGH80561.1 membrane protein [Pullulanibacillus pueri]
MHHLFHFINSVNVELPQYITLFGKKIYLILFIIIFAKTAYIVLTFLPGDATLFASGTIAASGQLHFQLLLLLFFVATVAGDAQNYLIGKIFSLFNKSDRFSIYKLIPKKSMDKTHIFLNNYGKWAIMFSRFIPLLSTTLPFIGGLTSYSFKRFISYNAIGAAIWAIIWVGAGDLIGNMSWVEHHMFLSLLGITLFSLLPPVIAFIIEYTKKIATASKVTDS